VGTSVTALTNENYVVTSSAWTNGTAAGAGAATWGDGAKGIDGPVTDSNSLVGTHPGDGVGSAVALKKGNYVVMSANWNNGRGAVTWGDGQSGVAGEVSTADSFAGGTPGDNVGASVVALANGNYVVASPNWTNGTTTDAGAVTWADGSKPLIGTITAADSLVGTSSNDAVGTRGVTALSSGNYVVDSSSWHGFRGAVTWSNGSKGVTGAVSAGDSFVGATTDDALGSGGVTPLADGNYVINSSDFRTDTMEFLGAATWVNEFGSRSGTISISSSNSFVGAMSGDGLGMQVLPAADGNYAVYFPDANELAHQAGAVTLGSGALTGTLSAANSVLGTVASGGYSFSLDYDTTHRQLVVGQPASNTVVLASLQATANTINLGGYMSGNWYDPQQSGHGFQLEFATNHIVVAIWFVYTPDGSGQNWIYAQGTYDNSSNTVTLPAIITSGTGFPPNFIPGDVQRTDWGTLTFSFTDCNHGTVTWSSPLPDYGVGSLPITRITQIAGTTCPN